MSTRCICDTIDDLEQHLLKSSEARTLLAEIRKSAERMECRLLRYRRTIEVLGFERVKHPPAEPTKEEEDKPKNYIENWLDGCEGMHKKETAKEEEEG